MYMKINEAYSHIVFQLAANNIFPGGKDDAFYQRFLLLAEDIFNLYNSIYYEHSEQKETFTRLINVIIKAYATRSQKLKDRDAEKPADWFLSNELAGMSLYVDRFCGNLANLPNKIQYLQTLGVNVLHLMPLFKSPTHESDGGYAVSDFRQVDERFGTLEELQSAQNTMHDRGMYLMLDIVLNHTSRQHTWAEAARQGDKQHQDYYYFFEDRTMPDEFDKTMPEIFPESAPGNFTYIQELNKWVMTVFHNYQWDLNYRNPVVLAEMIDTIFFYANIGVDILRIDAPAFIWKETGTNSQNLPQAHTILQLIKQCVQVATPGMALLGEAIVSPSEIMRYFGTGDHVAKECDFAYNATDMALQWEALATGDIRVLLAAQHEVLKKPYGTSWINYTRSHDDIGLGFDDYMIAQAGYEPFQHRRFLKNYYSGNYAGTTARGALFSVNEKTGDARLSGSLASLCGLEVALETDNEAAIQEAINKILLMQAHSFFLGGLPMIFYGDEIGSINDYSYRTDAGKSYDNRWMHRPLMNNEKHNLTENESTIEHTVFMATQRLLAIRKKLDVIADKNNITWLTPHNIHVSGYLRAWGDKHVYCLFNFARQESFVTWYTFKEHGLQPKKLYDHWTEHTFDVGWDNAYLILPPYRFCILEVVK